MEEHFSLVRWVNAAKPKFDSQNPHNGGERTNSYELPSHVPHAGCGMHTTPSPATHKHTHKRGEINIIFKKKIFQ